MSNTSTGTQNSVGAMFYETERDGAALNKTAKDFKSVAKTAAFTVDKTLSGNVTVVTVASAADVTLPRDLPVGFHTTIITMGAGQLTVVAGTGATLRKTAATAKTAAQYAVIRLHVVANADNASAVYVLSGDLAAS